ncbi:unnamed protein product [Prunus armeniaca]|uniref:Uncharacterized protein n=1 Tax=Prunus armeniaca TaxID=36596 RepID=A0A6J5TUN5_PRUAR|nr:unnamed protein product [Prunus armeniaca]
MKLRLTRSDSDNHTEFLIVSKSWTNPRVPHSMAKSAHPLRTELKSNTALNNVGGKSDVEQPVAQSKHLSNRTENKYEIEKKN